MTAKALLDANPSQHWVEINEALTQNHNLCRCTGYIKIFEAIQWPQNGWPTVVQCYRPVSGADPTSGKSLIDPIAVDMVTEGISLATIFVMERMLHGKILWSAHPHARILSIDTTRSRIHAQAWWRSSPLKISPKEPGWVVVRDQPAIAATGCVIFGDIFGGCVC